MNTQGIKIAIHHIEKSYTPKWIEYCKDHGIDYKLVNCYDTNIIEELADCDALLWHWNQSNYRAQLFARQLSLSLSKSGFLVYPNADSVWHYDDKVGQKYLFESIDAPLVKSYAFYDKESAMAWLETTTFPKVFKLRNGAGSDNVQLLNKKEAKRYIKRAFGRGFLPANRSANLREKIWTFKRDKDIKSFLNISKGIYRFFFPHPVSRELPIERNYVYAQDFIANCDHDIRVFVIGNRAVTKKRFVRDDDFRASGSGKMTWDIDQIPKECVQKAFEITDKLGMQSAAFDFVKDTDGYKIVEISYAASEKGFVECPGFWNRDLTWTRSSLRVEYFIIEDMLKAIERQRA